MPTIYEVAPCLPCLQAAQAPTGALSEVDAGGRYEHGCEHEGVGAGAFLGAGSLASVVHGQGWYGDGHITFYGSPNGQGTQAGACGYQNTYALGYGSMTAALSSPLFQGGAACGACYQIKCKPADLRQRGARNWCWSYAKTITITATNLCPPGSTRGCAITASTSTSPCPLSFRSLDGKEVSPLSTTAGGGF